MDARRQFEGYAMRDPYMSPEIGRLKRRADFLRAAKGKRFHTGAMTVQAGATDGTTDGTDVRIGFTLTRKVGNAVVRNRIRRRLKEAVRLSDLPVVAAHDYVIIGRIEAIGLPFETLKRDLARAIRGVHETRPRSDSRTRSDSRQRPDSRKRPDSRPQRTGPKP